MLGKVIVKADDRQTAITNLQQALAETEIYGIETNLDYLQQVLADEAVNAGKVNTQLLGSIEYRPIVLMCSVPAHSPRSRITGTPGLLACRCASLGPFDDWSFRLGNRMLDNEAGAGRSGNHPEWPEPAIQLIDSYCH